MSLGRRPDRLSTTPSNDGEDFELCLVVAPEDAERLTACPPPPTRLFRIGEIIERPGLWLRDPARNRQADRAGGFDHLMP